MNTINYKMAGVDIAAGNEAVKRFKKSVETTFNPAVLTPIGGFGAMYDLKKIVQQYQHPVLVQSIDGVGTKMMVAKMMGCYQTIGIDLVSATVNDIVVLGAKPLTLLDYIANDHLNPDIIEQIMQGMVLACRENDIALVGGETAEMPGTYLPGEHDLVGVITGIVEREKAILGTHIQVGDVVAAFPSNGLHTNGYSLARKLLFEKGGYQVDSQLNDFADTLGEVLLMPHLNYYQAIQALLARDIPIKGMAHITGGGLLENIPRILPANCAVQINKSKIPIQPLFNLLQHLGNLSEDDMYRTFNMGIGMVCICPAACINEMQNILVDFPLFPLKIIGEVVPGKPEVQLIW